VQENEDILLDIVKVRLKLEQAILEIPKKIIFIRKSLPTKVFKLQKVRGYITTQDCIGIAHNNILPRAFMLYVNF
jgi:hypothetical protein